jgi:hypothetical protein
MKRDNTRKTIQVPKSKVLQVGDTFFIIEDLWNIHPHIISEIIRTLVKPNNQEIKITLLGHEPEIFRSS